MKRILLLLVSGASLASAFSTASLETCRPQSTLHGIEEVDFSEASNGNNHSDRRTFLTTSITAATALSVLPQDSSAEDAPTKMTDSEGVMMYKTTSGLKYIPLVDAPPNYETSARNKTPRYGQLCVVSYKAYMKLPNAKSKEAFDSSQNYIIKHGNGRMIPGLDEGLHTMKGGETRRLIIPPKLGFIAGGLGPMPSMPWDRRKLNGLLEEMIKQRGGNLVYDVQLVDFFDDEADQGYYDDIDLSPEELEILQGKLVKRAAEQSQD